MTLKHLLRNLYAAVLIVLFALLLLAASPFFLIAAVSGSLCEGLSWLWQHTGAHAAEAWRRAWRRCWLPVFIFTGGSPAALAAAGETAAEIPTVNTSFVGQTVIALGILTLVVIQVRQLLTREPPLHKEFVAREDYDHLATQLALLTEKTDERFAAMSRASGESREKMYKRINDTSEAVASLNTLTTTISTAIGNLSYKLDQFLLNNSNRK